jgi:hypothetical protein
LQRLRPLSLTGRGQHLAGSGVRACRHRASSAGASRIGCHMASIPPGTGGALANMCRSATFDPEHRRRCARVPIEPPAILFRKSSHNSVPEGRRRCDFWYGPRLRISTPRALIGVCGCIRHDADRSVFMTRAIPGLCRAVIRSPRLSMTDRRRPCPLPRRQLRHPTRRRN